MAAPTIAVIGLGAAGLVTVKNLIEEGFAVTGFERNSYVGGLWKYTEGPTTSVLESTIANLSKERGCFTDFPFPKGREPSHLLRKKALTHHLDCPMHPTAAHVQRYLEDYAEHFSLRPRLRLGTRVQRVRYNRESCAWDLVITEPGGVSAQESFDKVVVASGILRENNVPIIEGIGRFKGQVFDSHTFKKPEDFDNQKVMIVGFSNTAVDTATSLVGHADKIYLSHRGGAIILPRVVDGKPLDRAESQRIFSIQCLISRHAPSLREKIVSFGVKRIQDRAFDIQPEWQTRSAPPLEQSLPIVSDTIIEAFREGSVVSVAEVKEIVGEYLVELCDGTRVKVDRIILCTGYRPDFSFLGELDPTTSESDKWFASKGTNSRSPPRLYQNTFSLGHPESLAFVGTAQSTQPAFLSYDLASMAIAQIWKGNSCLPSKSEMIEAVNAHHEYVCSLAIRGSVYPFIVKPCPWMQWVNDTAGTGMNDYFGYGVQGWKYWFFNRRVCGVLMTGALSPHIYRLFDGERKIWKGARAAIMEPRAE